MTKIQIILGSTRQQRAGEVIAKWVFEQAKKRKEFDVEFIDLRDWPLPFFDEPQSPSTSGGVYTLELAKKWAKKVDEADGYIIVTPEYNHGYSAVLKNALDYVYKEWNNKPVAFIGYGASAGGGRAVEQLRQVVNELHMVAIRDSVLIPAFWEVFRDGKLIDESYNQKLEPVFTSLSWYSEVLKKARAEK